MLLIQILLITFYPVWVARFLNLTVIDECPFLISRPGLRNRLLAVPALFFLWLVLLTAFSQHWSLSMYAAYTLLIDLCFVQLVLGRHAMDSWVPFTSQGYWDVPRVIQLTHRRKRYLLRSVFLEALDEYDDSYQVYELGCKENEFQDLPEYDIRFSMEPRSIDRFLGSVSVHRVRFQGKLLDASILDSLTA